jgi:hypothetical protein
MVVLVCPRTQQPLDAANPALVAQLQTLQRQRALRDSSGQLLAEPFDAGWCTRDGQWFYASRGGVLDLRQEAAVVVTPVAEAPPTTT